MRILFLLLLTSTFAIAQTKMIEHKSHSGTIANFDPENVPNSNFGVAPRRNVTKARLDSVIFVDEHTAIMVTSNCEVDFDGSDTTWWKPGRETVIDHPLFSKQHQLSFIKTELKNQYHFRNNINSVVFIGYDNKETRKNKKGKKDKKNTSQDGAFLDKTTPENWAIFGLLSLTLGGVAYYGRNKV